MTSWKERGCWKNSAITRCRNYVSFCSSCFQSSAAPKSDGTYPAANSDVLIHHAFLVILIRQSMLMILIPMGGSPTLPERIRAIFRTRWTICFTKSRRDLVKRWGWWWTAWPRRQSWGAGKSSCKSDAVLVCGAPLCVLVEIIAFTVYEVKTCDDALSRLIIQQRESFTDLDVINSLSGANTAKGTCISTTVHYFIVSELSPSSSAMLSLQHFC